MLRSMVDAWNAKHPAGTAVRVILDDGSTKETRTRGAAEVLGNHSAVVWLEGFSSCYLLGRCAPLLGAEKSKAAERTAALQDAGANIEPLNQTP
jgi:hypothetical protein